MAGLAEKQAKKIKAQYRQYLAAGASISMPLHERILGTWKRDSPEMYRRLQKCGVLEEMAFVCQMRMWEERDRLLESGMYYTDAREIAEREHLMLEPEEPPSEDGPWMELHKSLEAGRALIRKRQTEYLIE